MLFTLDEYHVNGDKGKMQGSKTVSRHGKRTKRLDNWMRSYFIPIQDMPWIPGKNHHAFSLLHHLELSYSLMKHLSVRSLTTRSSTLRYPFHLRPKNKQAFQYIRMCVDIIMDLELDQESSTDDVNIPPSPQRLEEIRIYLASYFFGSQ